MKKKHTYWLVLTGFLMVCMIAGIAGYVERTAQDKTVRGFVADYTYYDRKLSVSDFEQFGYDSTYEEIVEQLGMPNGSVSTNRSLPYYELKDGRFAVCSFTPKTFIYIANKENIEYYLLPARLKEKDQTLKDREVAKARQYDMNVILGMLEIKDWKLTSDDFADQPLGEYTAEKLRQYTDGNFIVETSYYFGSYHESVQLPLIQTVWIYEEQKPLCFGYVLWDTELDWHEWYIEDNAKYLENKDDYIEIAEKYELISQKVLINVDSGDDELVSINLSSQNIVNSLTEYLVKQKIISDRRNSRVEFWGEDGNGKYVCLIATNPWKTGWDIHADSRGTKYYFMTMDTKDGTVSSISIVQLNCRS